MKTLILFLACSSAAFALDGDDLTRAAQRGDFKGVQRALADGVKVDDLDYYSQSALHYAAFHGHVDIVRYLLNKGADPCQVTGQKERGPVKDVLKKLRNEEFCDLRCRERMDPAIKLLQEHSPDCASGKPQVIPRVH